MNLVLTCPNTIFLAPHFWIHGESHGQDDTDPTAGFGPKPEVKRTTSLVSFLLSTLVNTACLCLMRKAPVIPAWDSWYLADNTYGWYFSLIHSFRFSHSRLVSVFWWHPQYGVDEGIFQLFCKRKGFLCGILLNQVHSWGRLRLAFKCNGAPVYIPTYNPQWMFKWLSRAVTFGSGKFQLEQPITQGERGIEPFPSIFPSLGVFQ